MKHLYSVFIFLFSLVWTVTAQAQSVLREQNFREFQQLLSSTTTSPTVKPAIPTKDCTAVDALEDATPLALKGVQPQDRQLPCIVSNQVGQLILWNQIALDATAIDHAPSPPGNSSRSALQHLGPHRSARAMAIVHAAMFDAANSADSFKNDGSTVLRYSNYLARPPIVRKADISSAIAAAAFATLCQLYPAQAESHRKLYVDNNGKLTDAAPDSCAIETNNTDDAGYGARVGSEAAKLILDERAMDRSQHVEPQVGDAGFELDSAPGKWRPDPISGLTVALGGRWKEVKTFTKFKAERFRPSAPPPLTDAIYSRDYDEVKRIGGLYQTERRDFETFIGRFWAYDGTAYLCAPPRLYNQIVRKLIIDPTIPAKASTFTFEGKIKNKNLDNPIDVARILAMVNVAMADAAISAWEAKYYYGFWRPITGIRAGATDGNSLTVPDLTWTPLGAPATNSSRMPNFTPPFPAYPSGHAVFGGAVFEVLRQFFNNDTPFVFTSDEYNGSNKGFGEEFPRARLPQSFVSLSHPEYLNARSRVYLGVHWQFDADAGIAQGNQIGSYVFANSFQCLDMTGATTDCDLKTGLPQKPKTSATAESIGVLPGKADVTGEARSSPVGRTILPNGAIVR